jgi:hypothetical protein
MRKWVIFLVIGTWMYFTTPLFAQIFPWQQEEFEKLAQSTMTFLNIGVGARPVGMGGAFTCMENDVASLFWNPAGIAKIQGGAMSLNHTQWIGDTKLYGLAVAYGLGTLGTFGITFMGMDNGSIERTIPDPNSPRGFYTDGTFTVSQWAGGIAYGRQLTDKFTVGAQVKYVYQDLGDADIVDWSSEATAYDTLENVENQKGTVAFDFGTIYYTGFKDLRIGMTFRNFSQSVKYSFESFNLPVTFRVGLAMNVLSLVPGMKDQALQVCVEAVHPYDHGERMHVGCEYLFKNLFALRAGYRTNSDTGALSAGFGLTPSFRNGPNFRIDYAYSTSEDVFNTIQRISFGFEL